VSRPIDALLDFLRAEEARGVTHVHLDEEAKELLRDLHRRSRGGKAAAASRVLYQEATPAAAGADQPSKPTKVSAPSAASPAAWAWSSRMYQLPRASSPSQP
jgi:DNA polymerase